MKDLSLLWFCMSALMAGPVRFEYLTIEDGLSQGGIHAVHQDSQGFLWFGTQDGLNRYDGFQFRVFRHNPNETDSISGNYIKDIVEDGQARLWLATAYDGLSCYDPQTESFQSWRKGDAPAGLPGDRVTKLLYHKEFLWVGTDGGGLARVAMDGAVTHFGGPAAVLDLKAGEGDDLWLATDQGLTLFRHEAGQPVFQNFEMPVPAGRVNCLYRDDRGRLWLGLKSGRLLRFSPQKARYEILGMIDYPFVSMALVGESLWLGARGGGLFVIGKGDRLEPLTFESLGDRSLAMDAAWTIYTDHMGLVWVGTALGAAVYNPATSRFDLFRSRAGDENTLASNFVSVLSGDALDPNILWVGSYNSGLSKLNLETRRAQRLPVGRDLQGGLSFEYVSALLDHGDNRLWVGTFGGGLNLLDKARGRFSRIQHNPDKPKSISGNYITWIQADPTDPNLLWLGYDGAGVDQYHLKDGVQQRFRRELDTGYGLASNNIVTMLYDSRGRLWLGTNDAGLNRLDPGGSIVHFPAMVKGGGPSQKRITSMIELDGSLWFGTYGGGLNRLEMESETFSAYRTADGLPNDTVYGVMADDEKRIWLSTNAGLARFETETGRVKTFTVRDGIQGMEFNQKSCYRAADGRMFFGGTNGLTAFSPGEVSDDPFAPEVRLTAFRLYNEPMRPGDPRMSKPLELAAPFVNRIVLTHEEPVFSFEFAALHFAAPDKNRYSYQLEGFDRSWIDTDSNRRFAAYTNLPSGSYRFKVKAANKDGVWNQQGAAVDLVVLPPPWYERWARELIFGTLFLLAGVGFIYMRLADAKCRLESKVAERTAALAAQTKELEKRNDELVKTRQSIVLQEKMASLGMVSAGLAHEINNPAGFAHGSSQSLAKALAEFREFLFNLAGDDAEPEVLAALEAQLEPLFEHTNRIGEGTGRIIELVRDVRASSRTDRTDKVIGDLNRGLRTTLSLVRPNFKHAVKFNTDLADELTVLCWPNQLNQVFMNLLVNACHAVEARMEALGEDTPGNVSIRSHGDGDWAVIEIGDEGCGMSGDVLDKIFEPFFTTKGEGSGTGLGLSISRDIIERHDGNICVDSEVDRGTTFTIRLPRRS